MELKHLLQPTTRGQSRALSFNSKFVCLISFELHYGDVDVFIQFVEGKIFFLIFTTGGESMIHLSQFVKNLI